jgi:UDP-glucose 4-epimerase
MARFTIVGGAGFIGSHVVRRLLERPDTEVTVLDNLSSGSEDYLEGFLDDPRLRLVRADVKDLDAVVEAARGADRVFHFAANPDIARAVTEPAVDFWEGTYLTNNVLEACRIAGVARLTYASGSGVYGDLGETPVHEDHGPMHPVSTYGASKLGCEAMISAYCHMFELRASAFRFANVVGDRQTHGVTYDFVRKLRADPTRLEILGDGRQSKSYIHVDDVVDAMLLVAELDRAGFEVFNVGTADYASVREIADLTVAALDLQDVDYVFTGGARGWKGDVPIVRFDDARIRALGWANRMSSIEALEASIEANISETEASPA